MSSPDADRAEAAAAREWSALLVVVLPVLVLSMDVSILLLALPSIGRDLDPGPTQQLWTADIYGFTLAGFLITMGTLGDRIGRRRLLVWGAVAFAVVSAAAAYAPSPEALVLARALLGVAGATIMPSALATVAHLFRDPRRRESAIALVFGCFLVGGTLGPVVGGVLLSFFWWGSVFLVAVPVMALVVVLAPRVLPESSDPDAGRLDLPSVGLSLGGVLAFVGGLKVLARDGWSLPGAALAVAGVALLVLFSVRQLRLEAPLVDLSVLRVNAVRTCLVVAVLGGVVLGGVFFMVTQFLQLVHGLDPLAAGLWMMVPTGAMAVGTLLGPWCAARTRPVVVMAGGTLLAAVGLLGLLLVSADQGEAVLVGALSVALFGFGLPGGLGINVIVGSVAPERAGAVSGLSSTGQELGVALGLAALGGTALAVYRGRLGGSLGDAPAQTLARARSSLTAALDTDDPAVADAAREAFTHALHVVSGLSATVVLALAVLVALTLRHLPNAGAQAAPEPGHGAQPDSRTTPQKETT